ncbi:MipA/OmpV family protein [Algibacillus agarilyticus]|uniref:MipA/OmpV family protein n=1 Tax=Algibacillus agarilyticus TaxID=2234133 RepID=UPI000DD0A6E1|nr:MipA/OmpV family protein [Algibacillus agarilyticus]
MPRCKLTFFALVLPVVFSFSALANTANNSPQRDLTGFENADESQPLWEFGVGGASFNTTNYPASSERNAVTLAAPYVVYRGDIFRVGGGNGVRAVVVEKSDFELDLSVGGAFSAKSEDDSVRAGMPELDYLFEIGPQLLYRIKDYEFEHGGDARLNARLQARAAFSSDFNQIDQRGFVIQPTLTYQQRGVFFKETSLNTALSLTYASEKFQAYYYQVDPEFATSTRSAYNAKGGYLGSELSMSISFPIADKVRGFVGGSAKFFQGAANQDSPLYEKEVTYSLGIGFVWRLYESETKASW